MRDGMQQSMRRANIALAVMCPITFAGAFLLRDTGEAVLQAFGAVCFLAGIALFLTLDARAERSRQRDQ